MCIRCGRVHGCDARRSIRFKKSSLKLDRGNEGADDIDDIAAKTVERLGNPLAVRGESIEKASRKFFGARVDANADRIASSQHRLE